ncbi:hypothetical protein NP233_g12631 [Leucocoprinus birnbaumii]|uniref:arginine--tRNA ligase n=1 Tax=Leucocoprinus birnbaumii TaxID=56174 RepID=A0AAD5VJQ9_9AGAR|nr:hypothetical protein NP233_g12631 [Leucocoprinus birnbaumii]
MSTTTGATNRTTLPVVPDTDPSQFVLDSYKIAIAKIVGDALGLSVEQVYPGVAWGKKGVDFTVALPRFRLPGKVDELAKKVIASFEPNDYIASIEHDKAFLHFMCNTDNLNRDVLTQIHTLGADYGKNETGKGKKLVIEYSSPNIAKSFHVGHLRSTIIGAFLANLYKACGWEVVGLNYLGDWGTQFGLIAVGFEKYGSQEALEKDAIKHLFDVYVKINQDAEKDPQVRVDAAAWFRRMENFEPEALENWKVWRELSVKKYEEEYDRLNVHFDVYTGESAVKQESMDKALERLNEMGWNVDYLTRDIGGAIERYEKYKFDKMIYVVSAQQDLHLAQFFKVLELMEFPWAKDLLHINYGLVQGMSTRKGTVVFLNQIIEDATQIMHEQMQANEDKYKAVEDPEFTSREIGISGIKVQDMAAKRINNYTFSKERMFSFEGDTGPYLQYAHVRLASVGRKNPNLLPLPPPSEIATDHLSQYAQARDIVFLLGQYPDVVLTALKTHEPSGVVTYLFRLTHAVSSAWETVIVKGEPDVEKAKAKLFLFEQAKVVLNAGMQLLSLRPLDRM